MIKKKILCWYYRQVVVYKWEASKQGNVKFPWRLAKEEDMNTSLNCVWLERVTRAAE